MNAIEQDLLSYRPPARFDGATFVAAQDGPRLNAQLTRVRNCMQDGQWRTLAEIAEITGDPQASVSARLRDLRKARWGSHQVDRRSRGERKSGLFEYRISSGGQP